MLPLALLLSVATAVSAGRPIADPSLGPSPYRQTLSAIASNGTGFLAAWRTDTLGGGVHVDGVLLDCDGHRISAPAFRVASFVDARSIQLLPFDDHYAMAWIDGALVLHLDEISASGKVIRNIFTQALPPYLSARIFWNGEHFLEVLQTSLIPRGSRITVSAFDRNGAMLGSEVALDKVVVTNSAVTVVGNDFVLATTTVTEGLALRRISSAGHVGSRLIVDVHQPLALPLHSVVSAHGSDVVIAWQNGGLQGTPSIQTALVTENGLVDLRPPVEVEYNTNLYPQILRGESRLALVLDTYAGPAQKIATPKVLELDRDGHVLGSPVPLVETHESRYTGAVAICGETLYALDVGGFNFNTAILGMSFSIPQDQPNGSELIAVVPTRQSNPVVASDGVNSLAVWIDQTAESESLRGRVVARDGSPVTHEIELTRVPELLGPPAIAFGGGEYLVVWQSGNQILARRITSNGVLLEDAPFVVADGAHVAEPAVAWNGSQFLVAWTSGTIFGALVSTQANVSLTGQLSIDPAPPPDWNATDASPSIAWDGKQFVLAWTVSRSTVCLYAGLGCTLSDVRAIRLDRLAHAVDVQSTLISEDAQRASLTSNGRNVLAAVDDESGTHAALIDARRSSLIVGSPIDVFDAWTSPRSTAIWDGSVYEVIWRASLPDGWHLGMVPISEDGFRGLPLGLVTDPSENAVSPGASSSGLIVIPEFQNTDVTSASARTVAHRVDEMAPLPKPPAQPLAVDAVHISPQVVVVAWKDRSDDETGFVVEQKTWSGNYYVFSTVLANTEQATISVGGPGVFRIRAWNGGGMSAPSAEMTMHSPPRKRTVATK